MAQWGASRPATLRVMVSIYDSDSSIAINFLSDSFKNLVKVSSQAFGSVEALLRDLRVLARSEVPIGILQLGN